MPPEVIAVLGTLAGALVVGVINYFSNRSVKNQEWRLNIVQEQAAIRRKLYADFLVETQRLIIQAHEAKISSLTDLDSMNGKFAEICLLAPGNVIDEAKKVVDCVLTSHTAGPAKEEVNFSAIKEAFIAAARQDMERVVSEA